MEYLVSKNFNTYFSTYDQDNDDWSTNSCAEERKSGWWFRVGGESNCSMSNLNGLYTMTGDLSTDVGRKLERNAGVQWKGFHRNHYSLKFTEMKLKPHH